MQSSLERIIPGAEGENQITGDETLALHLERYHYAGKNLVNGNVADVACGVGYGSKLLAENYGEKIEKIIAVDNDKASIDWARKHFHHPLIEFIEADAMNFHSAVKFNNIISLETIEHLQQPKDFIQHMVQQLAPGGRFIASVPVTPSMDANPYHLNDFTDKSFRKMMQEAGLKEINSFLQVQPYKLFSLINKKEERMKDVRKNVLGYYFKHPSKFFLRIQSLIKDGFTNKYLVVVFEKPTGG